VLTDASAVVVGGGATRWVADDAGRESALAASAVLLDGGWLAVDAVEDLVAVGADDDEPDAELPECPDRRDLLGALVVWADVDDPAVASDAEAFDAVSESVDVDELTDGDSAEPFGPVGP
jgi:hypothetical protein